jgi:hypothetical protein
MTPELREHMKQAIRHLEYIREFSNTQVEEVIINPCMDYLNVQIERDIESEMTS